MRNRVILWFRLLIHSVARDSEAPRGQLGLEKQLGWEFGERTAAADDL